MNFSARPRPLAVLIVAFAVSASVGAMAASSINFAAHPVRLVADDWCPQHCQAATWGKGYIVDIVGQALASEGVAYSIVYRPWSRALRQTELGSFDGLLTPTVTGYPQFLFPRAAVGYQQYCFYVNATSPWRYGAPADLLGKRVAYLKESGFGELESFLEGNKTAIHVDQFTGGDDLTKRIFKFLAAGRADTVIMTSDVADLGRRLGDLAPGIRSAGCLAREKLAVGLSRADPARARQIAARLDSGIARLRQSGRLKLLLDKYGIALWPEEKR